MSRCQKPISNLLKTNTESYSVSGLTAVMQISPMYNPGACVAGTSTETQIAEVSLQHSSPNVKTNNRNINTHTPNSVCKNNKILNEEWSFDFCYNTKRINFFSLAWHTYPGSKPILEDGDSIGTRASGTPRIGTTRRMVTSFPACNLHSNDVILFIANNKIQCLTSLNRHNPLEFTFYAFPSSSTLLYHVFVCLYC